ncbi:MAG: prepilin-type N-terminal cleavage/methylation domain-containing protein, partial [Planctomycetota bacterium]
MRADSIRRQVGFSLVEMLLAVFILGIGVISISALFPAGIALQRLATDDVIGPIVAKNAMATLRAKLSQDDFGSFQDFGLANSYLNPGIAGTFNTAGGARLLVPSGDWCWMRPGFIFDNANTPADEGTIDIFSANFTRQQYGLAPFVNLQMANEINEGYSFSAGVERLYGIPYNGRKHPLFTNFTAASALANPLSQRLLEPAVTFTQAERSYPQGPQTYGNSVLPPGKPQYYWDCMFRRSAGRVQVAVFVYRVAAPGGDLRNYSVGRTDPALVGTAPSGSFDAAIDLPPIPLVYYAPTPGTNISWPNRTTTSATGITTTNGYSQFPTADEIPNTHAGTPFGPGRIWDDWMAPGQIW